MQSITPIKMFKKSQNVEFSGILDIYRITFSFKTVKVRYAAMYTFYYSIWRGIIQLDSVLCQGNRMTYFLMKGFSFLPVMI